MEADVGYQLEYEAQGTPTIWLLNIFNIIPGYKLQLGISNTFFF